jgi:hypothetical protein
MVKGVTTPVLTVDMYLEEEEEGPLDSEEAARIR